MNERLEDILAEHLTVVFCGINPGKAGYSALSGQREIAWGLQAQLLGDASVWVLPNPSGRNLAFSLEQLVSAYGQLREAIAHADQEPLLS